MERITTDQTNKPWWIPHQQDPKEKKKGNTMENININSNNRQWFQKG